MRKEIFWISSIILILSLITGCGAQSVAPDDVYHYTTSSFNDGKAQNISVEQTPDGIKITGSEISITFLPIVDSNFRAIIEPQDVQLNYEVKDLPIENGESYLKVVFALGANSFLPAQIPMHVNDARTPELYGPYPDVYNSQKIAVKIHPEVGVTHLAGLDFREEALLNIGGDGTVEVDREGVEAADADGIVWVARRVNYNDKAITIMVRK